MDALRSTSSYWYDTTPQGDFPALEEDARADVAVAGAGIAGLTAAYHLARGGRRVVVLDQWGVAMGETAVTTAHVAPLPDTSLQELADVHGEAGAKAAWDAGAHAADLVEETVAREGIDCGFKRLPAYVYGPRTDDPDHLRREADLAQRLGYTMDQLHPDAVPFPNRAVNRVPDQAKFRPRQYLLALAKRVEDMGGRVHGGAFVERVHEDGDGVRVETRGGPTVTADVAIEATNVPLHPPLWLYSKLYPYRSYVVAARTRPGALEDALYYDTLTPYHYTRVEPGHDHDLVIIGGEDHKVGQERHPQDAYRRLTAYLEDALQEDVDVEYRWSGQVIESLDGLPYVGPVPGRSDRVLVATAFTGDGMTYGTLAGWMLSERVQGRETPWDGLFDPARVRLARARTYIQENKDFPLGLAERFLGGGEAADVSTVPKGEGAVVELNGRKVAVHRTSEGELKALSAVCNHRGCEVKWNSAEQSWDCPCHGSRFSPDGEVLHGPAHHPLDAVDVDALEREARRE